MKLKRLEKILGIEQGLEETTRALRSIARELDPATVGAMHLTCADESEYECVDIFQRYFVRHLLPPLKFGQPSAFRPANLGGRYEPATVQLVEDHFATPESAASFKFIVLKVNSHVARDEGDRYGTMQRYNAPSHSCGALRALLTGGQGRHLSDLQELFQSGGIDRVSLLRERIEEDVRPLVAALVNARLQAQAIIDEAMDFTPQTPTVYLVLPCVTLNRPERDTELVCGYAVLDCRGEPAGDFRGLGDDPTGYAIRHEGKILHVEDEALRGSRGLPG